MVIARRGTVLGQFTKGRFYAPPRDVSIVTEKNTPYFGDACIVAWYSGFL